MSKEFTVVDNDIFSKKGDLKWQKAARAVFSDELTDRATVIAIRAAANVLRESGCEALPVLLSIASELTFLPKRPRRMRSSMRFAPSKTAILIRRRESRETSCVAGPTFSLANLTVTSPSPLPLNS
jgi:hypothetical protein